MSEAVTGSGRLRARAKRAAFALAMAAGVLGFLEAAGAVVYLVVVPEASRDMVDTALGVRDPEHNSVLRYRPHPYLNYVGNPEYVSPEGVRLHDAIGIRATDVDLFAKRPGAWRMVALGGSTTFGLYAPGPAKAWPGLVELALESTLDADVDVINAGVPNYTTYELIGFAALWLPEMHADVVVLHTGLNDAFTVGFPDEGGPDNSGFRHAWSYRPIPELARRAMRTSYLLRALGTGWLSRSGHRIGDMTPAMQYPTPPNDEVRRHAALATGRYFRRNLETLVTLIRKAGAEPILMDMPLNPRFERTGHPYNDAVSLAVARNNRIMAEVGAALGARVVDVHSRVRDPDVYLDAAHLGPRGMIQKAEAVVETVLPLIDGSGRSRPRAPGGGDVPVGGAQDRPHRAGVEADQSQR